MPAFIPRLHLPMRKPNDVISHLGKGEAHWRVGRSAHAAATTWFAANGMPKAVTTACNTLEALANLKLVDAFLERSVDLGDGHRPSQTDVLAICSHRTGLFVAAVEAKVDESFGPYVSDWLDGSPAKTARLSMLCGMLRLDPVTCGDLRYQLLHRSASALIEAQRYHATKAVLIVHSFCPNNTGFADYSAFVGRLGTGQAKIGSAHGPVILGPVSFFTAWATDTPPE
jgi:hypothetical protein